MPYNKFKENIRKRFNVGDTFTFVSQKFYKDENDEVTYPIEICKAFIKYFNKLYNNKVAFLDYFVSDGPNNSHVNAYIYVPGNYNEKKLQRDLDNFVINYDCKAKIVDMPQSSEASHKTRTKLTLPEDIKIAKKLFKEKYNRELDVNSEKDMENALKLYNAHQMELREWFAADVNLYFDVGEFSPNNNSIVIDLQSYYFKDKMKKDAFIRYESELDLLEENDKTSIKTILDNLNTVKDIMQEVYDETKDLSDKNVLNEEFYNLVEGVIDALSDIMIDDIEDFYLEYKYEGD